MASLRTVVFSVLLLAQLLIATGAVPTAVIQDTCAAYSSSSRVVKVNINSKRDQDGEWLTTFKAVKSDGNTDHFVVDVTQTVHDCAGGQAVQITGVIHGNKKNASAYDSLRFHPKCGTNVAISDDGKSVRKISDAVPLNGVALTHRPLRRNELFEVRLDKKLSSYSYCQGIGLTSYTPDNIPKLDHMWYLNYAINNLRKNNVNARKYWLPILFVEENGAYDRFEISHNYSTGNQEEHDKRFQEIVFVIFDRSGYWMYYHAKIHKDQAVILRDYGRDLDKLEVGDRIGVMVNNAGTLHFFVNGIDQGPAASNIASMVYGVYELYYNAAAGTIIDPSP